MCALSLFSYELVSPRHVTLTANSTPVVEGKESLQFSCLIPDGEQGHPDVYSYYWISPSAVQWLHSTSNSITIDSYLLNATLHNGEWQCKIGNIIGNSSTSTLNITVNGTCLDTNISN